MPTVNFVGEIASALIDVNEVSITWAVVPGSFYFCVRTDLYN
jgi:hypothetical protein